MPDQYGVIANLVFIVALYLFIWVVTKKAFNFALNNKAKAGAEKSASQPSGDMAGVTVLRSTNGLIHKLDEDILLVGRSSNCNIRISDEFTSQHHATLRKTGFTWLIEDEQSTNGTYVNGKRILKKTYINYGDTIVFGRTGFKLERG